MALTEALTLWWHYLILKAAVKLSNPLGRTENQDFQKSCKMQNFAN